MRIVMLLLALATSLLIAFGAHVIDTRFMANEKIIFRLESEVKMLQAWKVSQEEINEKLASRRF